MNISESQFLVLRALERDASLSTQRAIAEVTGLSVGTVNSALSSLRAEGLADDAAITSAGIEALAPFKVDNAIVMAAGFSSRFAPISYEKPKCLMKVRGEIMIERQIEQLKEAGIEDIVVVAGYKAEQLFYLEDKLGVRVAINSDFASRNNHSTLMAVRKELGNSLICSSDDYFTENPFNKYEYRAFYSACYAQGPTNEWCLTLGAKNRITGVEVGGADSWYMMGHVYFDRAFSKRMVEILEAEYDLPETASKLWETLYIEHLREFDMVAKLYDEGVIYEFDSLDEVRGFDPLFLENVDSGIFDRITEVLGCTKEEIRNVYPLKQGLTNLSCHFQTNEGEWVYRHPGVGTEKMIDRSAEKAAQETAKRIGLDDTFVFEDPETGWKISRFITNARSLDAHDDAQLRRAMEMARKLHDVDAVIDREFDYYKEGKGYESLLLEKGPIDIPEYEKMAQMAAQVKQISLVDSKGLCLNHNDFFELNLLLDDQDQLYLIDWEYAGMSDYANDFGTFVVTSQLSEDEAHKALGFYFDREPSQAEVCHNFAFVGLAGWCWYVWALLKEAEGDYVGDWLYIYYRYAKTYLTKTIELARELGIQG